VSERDCSNGREESYQRTTFILKGPVETVGGKIAQQEAAGVSLWKHELKERICGGAGNSPFYKKFIGDTKGWFGSTPNSAQVA
jgi:hypothetical protein